MFCIDFFKKNPKPFFRFAEEILPGRYQPSVSHKFISFLDEQKKLLRLYSQNIDALERAAGIKNLIEVRQNYRIKSSQKLSVMGIFTQHTV